MELGSCPRRRTTTSDYWSSIPNDILALIAQKLVSIDNYVRFTTVCRSWYSLTTETYDNSKHELNLVPLYMSVTNRSKRVTLKNPTSDTTIVLDLPKPAGTRCWESPFGWLITFNRANLQLTLLNPFTGATVPLPRLPKSRFLAHFPDKIKAFLTASPDSDPDNCLVILHSKYNKLAFTKPNRHSKTWSRIQGGFDLADLIHYKDNLNGLKFLTGSLGQLFLFQLHHKPTAVHLLNLDLTSYQDTSLYSEVYLVDLNGELCLCLRYFSGSCSTTINTKLFKIEVSTGKLTQIMSLGDCCLFLGNYYSFSCKAAYPRANLFEQPRHGTRGFVSNYVFYTYNRDWLAPLLTPDRELDHIRTFDVEVWDILTSKKVCSIMDSPTPLCVPLWIVPSIK